MLIVLLIFAIISIYDFKCTVPLLFHSFHVPSCHSRGLRHFSGCVYSYRNILLLGVVHICFSSIYIFPMLMLAWMCFLFFFYVYVYTHVHVLVGGEACMGRHVQMWRWPRTFSQLFLHLTLELQTLSLGEHVARWCPEMAYYWTPWTTRISVITGMYCCPTHLLQGCLDTN